MSSSFTTYWGRDRYVAARDKAPPGFRLGVLFGGPHLSLPSLRRAGVRLGDRVYPVHVNAGLLYVLGCMRVARLLTEEEFKAELARGDGGGGADAPILKHMVRPPGRLEPTLLYLAPVATHEFLAPTCTDEAALGDEGTPLWFDLAAPRDLVESLRYASRRGERPLRHVADGRITSISGLQGIYRLAPPSAAALDGLVRGRLERDRAGAGA